MERILKMEKAVAKLDKMKAERNQAIADREAYLTQHPDERELLLTKEFEAVQTLKNLPHLSDKERSELNKVIESIEAEIRKSR